MSALHKQVHARKSVEQKGARHVDDVLQPHLACALFAVDTLRRFEQSAMMRGGPAQLDLSSRRSSPGGESLSATKPWTRAHERKHMRLLPPSLARKVSEREGDW